MLLTALFQHFVVSIHPGMALSWLSAENLEALMEWMEGTKLCLVPQQSLHKSQSMVVCSSPGTEGWEEMAP